MAKCKNLKILNNNISPDCGESYSGYKFHKTGMIKLNTLNTKCAYLKLLIPTRVLCRHMHGYNAAACKVGPYQF